MPRNVTTSITPLPGALQAWCTPAFAETLKQELKALPPGTLPLQTGVTYGGLADDRQISITILDADEDSATIRVDIGIFFTEIIGGCSCGDEPAEENAYCELRVSLDKATGQAVFAPR